MRRTAFHPDRSERLKYSSRTLVAAFPCIVGLVLAASAVGAEDEQRNVPWYRQAASKWSEALALRNGRLGAMVFGTTPTERLQLNEESLWAGEPVDAYPPDFAANLKRVQQLVLAGKIAEARRLGVWRL